MAQLGHYIGPYRLVSIVGAGRACQVWEAVHEGTAALALKVLVPQQAKDSQQLGLMRHEFEVGRGLEHPRVIHTMEFDTSRQPPFLVLEFFGPTNLKQLILQGADQIAYLAPKIIQQAAEGLAYFHQQGWIHRDIKPNNFLDRCRGKRQTDRLRPGRAAEGIFRPAAASASKVQGTRSYISPEQIRRQALDQRSGHLQLRLHGARTARRQAPFTGYYRNRAAQQSI